MYFCNKILFAFFFLFYYYSYVHAQYPAKNFLEHFIWKFCSNGCLSGVFRCLQVLSSGHEYYQDHQVQTLVIRRGIGRCTTIWQQRELCIGLIVLTTHFLLITQTWTFYPRVFITNDTCPKCAYVIPLSIHHQVCYFHNICVLFTSL